MEKVAVWDKFINLRYILPVLLGLGEEAVFHCGPQLASARPEALAGLKAAGVEVVVDDRQRAMSHKYYLMDSGHRLFMDLPERAPGTEIIRQLETQGARFIFTAHGAEQAINRHFTARDFFLAPSVAVLADSVGAGKYLCDGEGRPLVGRSPKGTECAVAGLPYVTEEILALKRRSREELKEELAERLKMKFDPALPLVFYMVPQRNAIPATDRGLRRLAERANVLVKNWLVRPIEGNYFNVRTEVAGPNIFQVGPGDYQDGDLTFLMRFAADLNLVGLFSGSFITNVMIGLPTLPVYTRTIQAALPPRPFNYTVFLSNTTELCVRLAHGLAPMDIEATETIIERLDDKDYWERYENELPQLRQLFLGDYQLGREALDRTVFFIRRVLRVNSFNPSTLPPGGSIKDGPLRVGGGLCPIML